MRAIAAHSAIGKAVGIIEIIIALQKAIRELIVRVHQDGGFVTLSIKCT